MPFTARFGLYPLFVYNLKSNNSVLLKYNMPDVCDKKSAVDSYLKAVQYASYAALIVSAIPAKIVGL